MRTPKTSYRLPFCAACMWRCGLPMVEIDHKLGFRNAVGNARTKWGQTWVPVRQLGGAHDTPPVEAGAATSCGSISDFAGLRYRPSIEFERQEILCREIDHAFAKMDRPPLPSIIFTPDWQLMKRLRKFRSI